MTDILDRIEAYKRTEISEAKVRMPFATLERQVRDHDPPRGFVHAIEAKLNQRRIALIAEIKRPARRRASSARISIPPSSPGPMKRRAPPVSPS
jgi:indole-3-glycerol phosphate synthase